MQSQTTFYLGILPGRKSFFFLFSLLAYYHYSADFEFQALFLERVCCLIPDDVRQAKANAFFTLDSVFKSFRTILDGEFEAVSKE